MNLLILQRLVPVLSLLSIATSFIRLWRDHAFKKKIIHGASVWKNSAIL